MGITDTLGYAISRTRCKVFGHKPVPVEYQDTVTGGKTTDVRCLRCDKHWAVDHPDEDFGVL